jgi:hypothetical protein
VDGNPIFANLVDDLAVREGPRGVDVTRARAVPKSLDGLGLSRELIRLSWPSASGGLVTGVRERGGVFVELALRLREIGGVIREGGPDGRLCSPQSVSFTSLNDANRLDGEVEKPEADLED